MSTSYGHDSVAVHFTWRPVPEDVEPLLVDLEAALEPFGARPHWGKLFAADAAAIAPRYERSADFAGLVARLDPRRAFRNEWLDARVLGAR
jgi:xylitol oxidase